MNFLAFRYARLLMYWPVSVQLLHYCLGTLPCWFTGCLRKLAMEVFTIVYSKSAIEELDIVPYWEKQHRVSHITNSIKGTAPHSFFPFGINSCLKNFQLSPMLPFTDASKGRKKSAYILIFPARNWSTLHPCKHLFKHRRQNSVAEQHVVGYNLKLSCKKGGWLCSQKAN